MRILKKVATVKKGNPIPTAAYDTIRVRTFGAPVNIGGTAYTAEYTMARVSSVGAITGGNYEVEFYQTLFQKDYFTAFQWSVPDPVINKSTLSIVWESIAKSEVDSLKAVWSNFEQRVWIAPNETQTPELVFEAQWQDTFNFYPALPTYNEHWRGQVSLLEA